MQCSTHDCNHMTVQGLCNTVHINYALIRRSSVQTRAHDYRVMRSYRGWFCFPEIFIHKSITKDFMQLARYIHVYIIFCQTPNMYIGTTLVSQHHQCEQTLA